MKTIALFLLFPLTVLAGERNLTGNARLDLLAISGMNADSSTVTRYIMVQNVDEGKLKKPLLAGALSLLVPGAGEFYSGSYIKSAIFFSAEVAAIAVAIMYNNKGDSKTSQFEAYANAHWSALRYAKWIAAYGVSDYGPTNFSPTQADYDAIDKNHDFSTINAWESSAEHSEGFSHQLPKYGEQQYYELIGKYNQYKFGWDQYEVNGVTAENNGGIPPSDLKQYDSYVPQQMLNYAVDRGKANNYYYAAGVATGIVVVNHLFSAVDAALSANSYNKTFEAQMGMRLQNIGGGQEVVPELHMSLKF